MTANGVKVAHAKVVQLASENGSEAETLSIEGLELMSSEPAGSTYGFTAGKLLEHVDPTIPRTRRCAEKEGWCCSM